MREILSLKLPSKAKIFVKVGERVKSGSILCQGEEKGQRFTFPLAKIFKIRPEMIDRVLAKKIGEKVRKGEVLAKKEGFFGKMVLKSPIDGFLSQVSQILGEVVLEKDKKEVSLKTPVEGVVSQISEEEIKIDFEGKVFEGNGGGGESVIGIIENLAEDLSVLDLPKNIFQKILVSLNFSLAVLAKASALGAVGVVGESFSLEDPPLPFLTTEKKNIEEIKNYQGKKAVLVPDEKKLIILL